MMKKCPFCGADIEENARFCLYCMQSLTEKEQIISHQKKKPQYLTIIAAIGLSLVALVVAGFSIQAALKNRSSSDAPLITEMAHTPAAAVKENYVDSSCTETGSYDEVVYCSVCEKEISRITKTVDKKDHDYSQKVVSTEYLKTEATETEAAEYYYSCTCGAKGTTVFSVGSALGHTCSFDQKYTSSTYRKSPATCTEKAVYYYSCVCGEKGTVTFTSGAVASHTLGEWIVDFAATCTEPGARHKECACGYQTASVPYYMDSTAHKYDSAWSFDDAYHWHKCQNAGCASVSGKDAHNVTDGVCADCAKTVAVTTYTRDGDYIYFGEYPQSLKADDVTITDNMDVRGYYLGSDGFCYAKVTAKPFIRGYAFSSGESVQTDVVYYFKVEPIRWRILSEDGDTALILCDSIIANKAFDEDRGGNRDNNYADSTIRAWLNEQFYNTAFNELQKKLIDTVLVDNSVASTDYSSNKYACEDTNDKVFLLSHKEVTNPDYGFSSIYHDFDTARQMTVSDYARATGAYMDTSSGSYGNGDWRLRSPYHSYYFYACLVYSDGDVCSNDIDIASIGVVPALQIRLSDSDVN